jgi:hypothetical protein
MPVFFLVGRLSNTRKMVMGPSMSGPAGDAHAPPGRIDPVPVITDNKAVVKCGSGLS